MARKFAKKRVAAAFGVVALLGWLSVWGLANALAPGVVRKLSTKLGGNKNGAVTIDAFRFGKVRVGPTLTRIAIHDVDFALRWQTEEAGVLSPEFHVNEVVFAVDRVLGLSGTADVSGLQVEFSEKGLPGSVPFERFENGQATIEDLNVTSPSAALGKIKRVFREMFYQNSVQGEHELEGDVRLKIAGSSYGAFLYTVPVDSGSVERRQLRFRESDVRKIARAMNLQLAKEQVEIASQYPLRVPVFLVVTDKAQKLSEQSAGGDPWLKDAMRHTVWSYLLAKRFGSEFAKKVTDAQETKDGNRPDERQMDYHNNAVGRKWAKAGVPESVLLDRVRTDASVIRRPSEVAMFGGGRLMR